MHAHPYNWDDLLGRTLARRPEGFSAHLHGKRVLITGAAGCIGSGLAHAISQNGPEELVLIDASEKGVYEIDQHFSNSPQANPPKTVLGNICDAALLAELFERHKPQIVFHAAAFKHVPLLERNPFSAIANNTLGTRLLSQLAVAHRCEQLILVSTDKAADPLSMMGVSKRIAEMILLASLSEQTQMKVLRLGNVLNSPGSIVPLFAEQIASARAMTVTHPEVRRFFLTIDEAVAALLAVASPQIASGMLIPKMGEPIRIVDLARYIFAALRSESKTAPEIAFTALRPGDKLDEALIAQDEAWSINSPAEDGQQTLRRVMSAAILTETLNGILDELDCAVKTYDKHAMLQTIAKLVPRYSPSTVLGEPDSHTQTAAGVGL